MTKKSIKIAQKFLFDYFDRSAIHGFSYLGNTFFHLIERLLWIALICIALYFSVILSLESWDRYLHHSTVVSIERDHYYWNTSLPALTICPMKRLNLSLYEAYAESNQIAKADREEFFIFLESLANSTYINFDQIKNTPKTDEIVARLNIQPKDYLRLIYSLTEDLSKTEGGLEMKVRSVNNLEFIRVYQVLTEYGICYSTNNYLALNLSTSFLLDKKLPKDDEQYKGKKLHDVRYGNLFDGEMTYSFIGYRTPISVFMHSPYEFMNAARPYGNGSSQEAWEFETLSIEIDTTSDFREDTFISQRGCRFHWESNLTHYAVYSKNLCMSECRLELAFRLCRCIPHFYLNGNDVKYPKRICNYKELQACFPKYRKLFLEFQTEDNIKGVASKDQKNKEQCYCLQNCRDSNIIVEKFQMLKNTKALLGSIGGLVSMKKYPLIRFQREVIFTLTDFFVSVGGTAGLFVGVSVLNVIELIYFFSIRLVWFLLGYKKN